MRVVAGIYLTIVLVNAAIWLSNDMAPEQLPTAYLCLGWALLAFSTLALLAYIIGNPILPRRAWKVALAVYLAIHALSLLTTGFVLPSNDLVDSLNSIAGYLWNVLPPALAMGYLAFKSTTFLAGEEQQHRPVSRHG